MNRYIVKPCLNCTKDMMIEIDTVCKWCCKECRNEYRIKNTRRIKDERKERKGNN